MKNWASEISKSSFFFNMKSKKLVVELTSTDGETGWTRHKYYIANIPENNIAVSTSSTPTSSGITWRNDVLDVTHSYELPDDASQFPRLPPKLPQGMVRIGIFKYGTFYQHNNQLLVYKTDENIFREEVDHFRRHSYVSTYANNHQLSGPNQPTTITAMNFDHNDFHYYRLAPPTGIPKDYEYRVDAFDDYNLTAFVSIICRRGGRQIQQLHKVQY
ncbi:hypothetical protein SISSUDRAFT_1132436 [Sistotremastrum suecicum HHB10207 ss-3]|uniref:Uncharacterized protein n=1 Tax=Sistotremastrum suecicum HHB10207 ss-3 TaxID=1314776 RepID=A0A165YUI6_9AGAM|nr:hypothetical protein SISSUDRAFT_1132436 [Sistotremastrum suecicum HHB10207 ss-3]